MLGSTATLRSAATGAQRGGRTTRDETSPPSAGPGRGRLAPLLLLPIFALALWVPIPTAPNAARAEVVALVAERLPGWRILRARPSWERAWSVVANCAGRSVGFQLVPGHGLPPGDAWLHPTDGYAHARLSTISDDRTYLVWYRDPERARTLRCRAELARSQPEGRTSGRLDARRAEPGLPAGLR